MGLWRIWVPVRKAWYSNGDARARKHGGRQAPWCAGSHANAKPFAMKRKPTAAALFLPNTG